MALADVICRHRDRPADTNQPPSDIAQCCRAGCVILSLQVGALSASGVRGREAVAELAICYTLNVQDGSVAIAPSFECLSSLIGIYRTNAAALVVA